MIPTRTKSTSGSDAGSSLSVRFDETVPVNNTQTLVAVVEFSGTLSDVLSVSWPGVTFVGGSGNSGSAAYLGLLIMRGDGVTNDLTIKFNSSMTQIAISLMAFSGYVSTTTSSVVTNNGSGSSAVVGPATGPITAEMIHIAAVTTITGGGGTWGVYDNSFESLPAQSRLRVGIGTSNSLSSPPSTSISWSSVRSSRSAMWSFQGTRAEAIGSDTVPPDVSIKTPTPGSTVGGSIVATAIATDNVAVNTLKFYRGSVTEANYLGNGTLDTGSTWVSPAFDTRLLADGQEKLIVVATDAIGNSSRDEVLVNIDNTLPPVNKPVISFGDLEIEAILKGNVPVERIYFGATLIYGQKVPVPTDPEIPTDPTDPTDPEIPPIIPPIIPPVLPPETVPGSSFGPKGKYWAPNTPDIGATFDVTVTVDPKWDALAKAITDINTSSIGNKAKIKVRRGLFPAGYGSASSSNGVLQKVGSKLRTHQILIVPEDEYGSVGVTGSDAGFAFVEAHGISIMGIDFGVTNGLMIRNSTNMSIGYTFGRTFNMTANGGTGLLNCFYVEFAAPEVRHRYKGDRGACRLVDPYTATNCGLIGGYLAPGYMPKGSDAHNDTYQLSASGRPVNKGFQFIDMVIFNSSHQGIIFTETPHVQGVVMDKVLIIGGYARMSLRHPGIINQPDGLDDDIPSGANSLWGGGQTMTIKNSIVMGSVASANQFDLVENTDITETSKAPVKVGKFGVATKYQDLTLAELNALTVLPTEAWKQQVWAPVFA
jgi:hypothetical protein